MKSFDPVAREPIPLSGRAGLARSEAAKEKDETGKAVRPRKHGSKRDMPDSRHGGDYTQGERKEKAEFTAAFPPDGKGTLRGMIARAARRFSTRPVRVCGW